MKISTIVNRLMDKVSIDEMTGCWNWTAAKVCGYGSFDYRGVSRRAHRVSYEFHCGPTPDGVFVCHRCDNRACVNPDHLFLGTNSENMADMVAKGRQPRQRGSVNGKAKLTEADVIAIRAARGPRGLQARLAEQYGVSQSRISTILSGKHWTHI